MGQLPPPPPVSGRPPPPPFRAAPPPEIRPSRSWYWIGAGVGLVCVLLGIVLIVRAALTFVEKVEDFPRVAVPGTTTIRLDEGAYTIYAEGSFVGDTDTWTFDGSVEIRDSRERLVELRRYGSRTTYDISGHAGFAVWSFRAADTGEFRVTTSGSPGTVVAIGPGLGAGLVGGVLGGILLIIAGGLFAVITIIVTAVRRGSARRRQLAAGFRPPPS